MSAGTDEPGVFTALKAVRDARGMTGTEKAVLTYLALHGDGKTGERCFPSTTTLAEETCLGLRTTKRALATLAAKGLIRRGDQGRAPKSRDGGKPVVVWDLDLGALQRTTESDIRAQGARAARSKVPESPPQRARAAHDLPFDLPLLPAPTSASAAADGAATTKEEDDRALAAALLADCLLDDDVTVDVVYQRMRDDYIAWPGRYLTGADLKSDRQGVCQYLGSTGYALPHDEWLDFRRKPTDYPWDDKPDPWTQTTPDPWAVDT